MNAINETAAGTYFKIVGVTAVGLVLAALLLATTGAVIATALGYNALLVAGSIVAGAIVLSALIGLDALKVARDLIVSQIAAHVAKKNAEAQKLLAEADRIDAEIRAKSLPTGLPQLPIPTETRVIPVTAGERAGDIAAELVNGHDPRFLDWWAQYLANGGKTSEGVLETMTMPFQGGKFGGTTNGTPLSNLLDLCEAKHILTPRDGERRKSGKLCVSDEKEIGRLLKQP